jgi:hypothetical protein
MKECNDIDNLFQDQIDKIYIILQNDSNLSKYEEDYIYTRQLRYWINLREKFRTLIGINHKNEE